MARRLRDRQDDYLRFATDLRIPFDNNGREQDDPDDQALC